MAEHKVIEKADSEEEKKKRKLLIIKIIPVAVLAFILIAVSLAWFTIDKALDLDSFGMKSVDSPFELKTVAVPMCLKLRYLTAMTTLRCLMGATSLLTRTIRSTGFLMKKAV